jgi:flavin reductase (DIM6/NTAB) family NADH-FMN oxidoreductase RutF
MQINLSQLTALQKTGWLQSAIAPRPIALASTINALGQVNLSPFSFFNVFSIDPPIIIFSPSRRVRDNSTKHTLENVLEIPEVVINICDFDMVHQMSVSSCEFDKGVDEFSKSGFTKKLSTTIKPPIVAEAKIAMECKVIEVKSLGNNGGAGQLIIAEIVVMHIDDNIINVQQTGIDPLKINQIARLGDNWYCQTNENNLFTVPKPNAQIGIGVDGLPLAIKESKILTGNHLGMLANVAQIPFIDATFEDQKLKDIVLYFSLHPISMEAELHSYAAQLLNRNKIDAAWQVLLMCNE